MARNPTLRSNEGTDDHCSWNNRDMALPGFSIVIPTFQRKELVCAAVSALGRLRYAGEIELIVSIDGSTDGTEEALAAIETPFPKRTIMEANQGAAAARNAGAALAGHEFLLFLDDDMIADPALLDEHARSYSEGADAVLGHIPLDPQSPQNFLSRSVAEWAEERCQRLSASPALSLFDLLTGQLSLRRHVFLACGEFDPRFTSAGSFGDEDLDFGATLLRKGHRIVFNPKAISYQRYVVSYRSNMRQWHQAGRADVAFARKHPERAQELFELHGIQYLFTRRVMTRVARLPFVTEILARIAIGLAERAFAHPQRLALAEWAFFLARDFRYWRGVQEAGGVPRKSNPVLILCYHAIAELSDDPILRDYGTPPEAFMRQIDDLAHRGCAFLSGAEFDRYMRGEAGVPRKAVLLTFDDCYRDLLEIAAPVLKARGIPAIAFAVTGLKTNSNEWDQRRGTRTLTLLDQSGLAQLQHYGIELGAHSRTHESLPNLDTTALIEEIAGSAADIKAMHPSLPRFFAYPYGEENSTVRRTVAAAGYSAAFGLVPAFCHKTMDAMAVPRVEILGRDRGWRFALKTRYPRLAARLIG